ncbi:MAG: PKD domain-containing protein [Solirubrobacteraceae bacterium]
MTSKRMIVAVAAVSVLAATGLSPAALASGRAAVRSAPVPAPPPGPPPTARLRVPDRDKARQNHGILFDASKSTGQISMYVFDFGDGITEMSYQPLALHGYRKPGDYQTTVLALAPDGAQAESDPVIVHVRDGLPPVVSIASPRPNQRLRFPTAGLLLRGAASDSGSGVQRVEIALQLADVHSRPPKAPKGDCVWFDGRRGRLVFSACTTPVFFRVRFAGQRWRFRVGPHERLPTASYVVRVRAFDRAGNVSAFFTIALRTILPFFIFH